MIRKNIQIFGKLTFSSESGGCSGFPDVGACGHDSVGLDGYSSGNGSGPNLVNLVASALEAVHNGLKIKFVVIEVKIWN